MTKKKQWDGQPVSTRLFNALNSNYCKEEDIQLWEDVFHHIDGRRYTSIPGVSRGLRLEIELILTSLKFMKRPTKPTPKRPLTDELGFLFASQQVEKLYRRMNKARNEVTEISKALLRLRIQFENAHRRRNK